MFSNMETRLKYDTNSKVLKLIEQVSPNSDVIYQEVNVPFPLTNRDFVQKRFYVGNKENPEVIKELGLYDYDHKYYVMMVSSTERPEYPPTKLVRAETKFAYWMFEENPKDSSVVVLKLAMCQDIKGNIPQIVVNKTVSKVPQKMANSIIDNYPKLFGKN